MEGGRCAPIRMLTITGQNLVRDEDAAEQLSLFEFADGVKPSAHKEKYERLEAAITQLRLKHGEGSVSMGCVENEALGIHSFGRYGRKRRKKADDKQDDT
jgi:hypothetical protein